MWEINEHPVQCVLNFIGKAPSMNIRMRNWPFRVFIYSISRKAEMESAHGKCAFHLGVRMNFITFECNVMLMRVFFAGLKIDLQREFSSIRMFCCMKMYINRHFDLNLTIYLLKIL